MNIDLYPGKSKTVPPPILLTSLVRSLIKISMVQTNIRKTVRNGLHALSTYYMGPKTLLIIQQLFDLLEELTFEMSASSRNYLEQIQQFVFEFCRYT